MARSQAVGDQRALCSGSTFEVLSAPPFEVFVFIDHGPSARCVRAFVGAVSAA